VLRAKIVLAASAGLANQAIARRLDVAINTVRKWRARFGAEGLAGLVDQPRSGRPRGHPAAVVAYAKAIACELPATKGVPLGRWSLAELREELLPAAWHHTDRYANNRVECDHGRLKAPLRPMRGLKQDRSARVIIAGHALAQNVRRGHYELATEEPTNRRLAVAFDELAVAI
jgi:transposase